MAVRLDSCGYSRSVLYAEGPLDILEPEDVVGIGHGTDILIVDDHSSNLDAYEAALAPLQRKFTLVKSGVEAIEKLLQQDFAVMLLDVSMPGMSGLETARMIRQRPRCKGMPIIFITGLPHSDELILEAYVVGGYDFVAKPVHPGILRAKVRVYLQLQATDAGTVAADEGSPRRAGPHRRG